MFGSHSKGERAQCHPQVSHLNNGNLIVYNQFQARTGLEKNAASSAAAVWKVSLLSCHNQQQDPNSPSICPAEKGAPMAAGHRVLL